MLHLPNNCRAGKFSYYPKNWNTAKASIRINWRVTYWFYDDNLGKRKKVKLQSVNKIETLEGRQEMLKSFVEEELSAIKAGLNHITKKSPVLPAPSPIVEPLPKKEDKDLTIDDLNNETGFADALQIAYNELKVVKTTKDDIKSCLKYFKMALKETTEVVNGLDVLLGDIPISKIGKGHSNRAMKKLGVIKKEKWTNNNFNHYRKYISILFEELVQAEVIEFDPMKLIKKLKTTKKIRTTLTQKERIKVDKYLFEKDKYRWRFMHIFFHSGCRETEMLRLKKPDVDLENRRFKVTILKGRSYIEKWRPIKDIAFPLWQQVYNETPHNFFLFGKFMKPAQEPINARQISRWWRNNVKKPLKISADFYALKHANTTEIMDRLAELNNAAKQAAETNAHTTSAMVVSIYDVEYENRKNEIIRKANNAFV